MVPWRIHTTHSGGDYNWDNANRLVAIAQGSPTVTFAYDNADRRTAVTLPDGIVTNYAYNAASQLTSITYQKGATTLGDLTYTFDNAGRRTSIGGSFARTDLPAVIATTAHNGNNELTQWGTSALAFDLNGNLTNDGVYSYTWNARNQLVQVQQGATAIAGYQYDAFGRRRQKVINGATTQFVYDGQDFVQERDAASTVTANLLTGLGLDEVYARTKGAATISYLTDHLGSIIEEADAAGVLQTAYRYEPYGKTSQSGIVSDSGQRFTSREQDTADLYYYRARYHSAQIGRFISPDPIGWSADANLYRYTASDPVNSVDPLGLRNFYVSPPYFWRQPYPGWPRGPSPGYGPINPPGYTPWVPPDPYEHYHDPNHPYIPPYICKRSSCCIPENGACHATPRCSEGPFASDPNGSGSGCVCLEWGWDASMRNH